MIISKLIAALAVCASLVFMFSVSQAADISEKELTAAEQKIQNYEYEKALIMLEKMAAAGRGGAQVEKLLGDACLGLDMINDAIDHYKEAARLEPENFAVYMALGEVSFSRYFWGEAADYFMKALDIEPHSVLALNYLGCTLTATGDIENAVKYLKKAISLDSRYPDSYLNLGTVMIQINEFDKAIDAITQSIRLDPGSYLAFSNLSYAYYNVGKYEEALDAIEHAVRLNPDDPQILKNLSFLATEIASKRGENTTVAMTPSTDDIPPAPVVGTTKNSAQPDIDSDKNNSGSIDSGPVTGTSESEPAQPVADPGAAPERPVPPEEDNNENDNAANTLEIELEAPAPDLPEIDLSDDTVPATGEETGELTIVPVPETEIEVVPEPEIAPPAPQAAPVAPAPQIQPGPESPEPVIVIEENVPQIEVDIAQEPASEEHVAKMDDDSEVPEKNKPVTPDMPSQSVENTSMTNMPNDPESDDTPEIDVLTGLPYRAESVAPRKEEPVKSYSAPERKTETVDMPVNRELPVVKISPESLDNIVNLSPMVEELRPLPVPSKSLSGEINLLDDKFLPAKGFLPSDLNKMKRELPGIIYYSDIDRTMWRYQPSTDSLQKMFEGVEPACSPSGNRLAFIDWDMYSVNLYVYDFGTSVRSLVYSTNDVIRDIDFSPSGKHISFSYLDNKFKKTLQVVSLETLDVYSISEVEYSSSTWDVTGENVYLISDECEESRNICWIKWNFLTNAKNEVPFTGSVLNEGGMFSISLLHQPTIDIVPPDFFVMYDASSSQTEFFTGNLDSMGMERISPERPDGSAIVLDNISASVFPSYLVFTNRGNIWISTPDYKNPFPVLTGVFVDMKPSWCRNSDFNK